jgi:hypothetical protein
LIAAKRDKGLVFMSDFALAICETEKETKVIEKNIFKRIAGKIKALWEEPPVYVELRKVEINENINIYVIILSYTIEELECLPKAKRIAMNMEISKMLAQLDITKFIVPDAIFDVCRFEEGVKNSFKGNLLYKCLLTDIISKVYIERGIKIGDLDITIVQGKSIEMLQGIIKILLSVVKYLTIVCENGKEVVEEKINNIFLDTGLAIRVTDDFISGVKNSELVINLGSLGRIPPYTKLNPNTVIINFGEAETIRNNSKFTLLNGVEIDLPKRLESSLDQKVFKFFNKLQLAEMIILNSLGLGEDLSITFLDGQLIEKVSAEFRSRGYSIKSFKGRHSILMMDDIRVSIK